MVGLLITSSLTLRKATSYIMQSVVCSLQAINMQQRQQRQQRQRRHKHHTPGTRHPASVCATTITITITNFRYRDQANR
ncbi:hypothetical protein BZA77DRAFT_319245 [Pyronema omphalodes]|nr:hypothetical protein BZA77DRAFT_319245 [Pyronema omphalodes]